MQNLQTGIDDSLVHHFDVYLKIASANCTDLTLTETAADRAGTLPLYPTIEDEQVEWVV